MIIRWLFLYRWWKLSRRAGHCKVCDLRSRIAHNDPGGQTTDGEW